jgi:hypothetical protein
MIGLWIIKHETMSEEDKKQLIIDAVNYVNDFPSRIEEFLTKEKFKKDINKYAKYYIGSDPYEGQLPVFWDLCRDASDDSIWVCIPPDGKHCICLSRMIPIESDNNGRIVTQEYFKNAFYILNRREREMVLSKKR